MCDPGSKVVYSPEQSDKSILLAAECCIAHAKQMANVVIVKHTVDGAEDVSRKIRDVVHAMHPVLPGGDVLYLRGAPRRWRQLMDEGKKRAFEQGKLTLVVAPTPQALGRLHEFLSTVQPNRLLLLGDEADELWSHHVTPETFLYAHTTQRERQLYKLLRTSSCLHAFVQVSVPSYAWTCDARACYGLELGH